MDRKPKAIALFCGAGGLSLGFTRAGFDVAVATDIDADAILSYSSLFPRTQIHQCDIRNLDARSLPTDADVLIGGPPCQGFSSAGQKFWADPRNGLLTEYVRILAVLRPKWFLMENVEGLLTTWAGQYICEAVKAFLSLGYNVAIEKVYANAYGVPQRRKRVIVVGNRLGHTFAFPAHKYNLNGRIFRKCGVTFQDAVSDLPAATMDPDVSLTYDGPPATDLQQRLRCRDTFVSQHFFLPQGLEQQARIKALRPGQSMKHLPDDLHHDSFRRRAYRRVCDGTPSERRGGAPSGIKRLIADEPALTITGAAMREFIHPSEDRPLSLRECARLQTFPDDCKFVGAPSSCLQQIANAVPPLLAEVIAIQIARHYGFDASYKQSRTRLRFRLTESIGMSPALLRTEKLLSQLAEDEDTQLRLFEETMEYVLS